MHDRPRRCCRRPRKGLAFSASAAFSFPGFALLLFSPSLLLFAAGNGRGKREPKSSSSLEAARSLASSGTRWWPRLGRSFFHCCCCSLRRLGRSVGRFVRQTTARRVRSCQRADSPPSIPLLLLRMRLSVSSFQVRVCACKKTAAVVYVTSPCTYVRTSACRSLLVECESEIDETNSHPTSCVT